MLLRKILNNTLLVLLLLVLSACSIAEMKAKLTDNYNEQLYVDAQLGFAIKHPLDWQREQIPASSPEYRVDVIRWQVKDLKQQNRSTGAMLIRSHPGDPETVPADLLTSYLAGLPTLKLSTVEKFAHPAGKALKLVGYDDQLGRLTVALKGDRRDFIISLDYPSSRFDELLPMFQDIVDSFVEINPTEPDS